MNKNYDVVILGAGPSGTSCALALRKSGLKVALIDKGTFPRDKTCGDAIPGPSLRFLKELMEESIPEFDNFELKQRIYSSVVFLPNGKQIKVNWNTKAYNSKRLSFDNFLLDLVKKYTDTTIHEGVFIKQIARVGEQIHITGNNSDSTITCDMIIGCDGANSIVARTLDQTILDDTVDGVALRAYYENVKLESESNEFYLLKNFKGYFWIFPVGDNNYNVGIGIVDGQSVKAPNLKKFFEEVIADNPIISERFKNAHIESKILGFKLPVGGFKNRVSGERFLLVGDAAHLVDPLQGHGIDKAIKSGMLAAEQVQQCFQENDFSEAFISDYDTRVHSSLGKELERNFRIMKVAGKYPWLLSVLQPILKGNIDLLRNLSYIKKGDVFEWVKKVAQAK